jgi:hypothetical protein
MHRTLVVLALSSFIFLTACTGGGSAAVTPTPTHTNLIKRISIDSVFAVCYKFSKCKTKFTESVLSLLLKESDNSASASFLFPELHNNHTNCRCMHHHAFCGVLRCIVCPIGAKTLQHTRPRSRCLPLRSY